MKFDKFLFIRIEPKSRLFAADMEYPHRELHPMVFCICNNVKKGDGQLAKVVNNTHLKKTLFYFCLFFLCFIKI